MGTSIRLWDYYSNNAQVWLVTSVGNSYYKIASKLNTFRGWDVPNCNMDGTQNLQLWDYYGTTCQLFKFNYIGMKSAKLGMNSFVGSLLVEICPIPSMDGNFTINISSSDRNNFHLSIYNIEGKKIFEQYGLKSGTNEISSYLPKGTYYIKVDNNTCTIMKKLIIL